MTAFVAMAQALTCAPRQWKVGGGFTYFQAYYAEHRERRRRESAEYHRTHRELVLERSRSRRRRGVPSIMDYPPSGRARSAKAAAAARWLKPKPSIYERRARNLMHLAKLRAQAEAERIKRGEAWIRSS